MKKILLALGLSTALVAAGCGTSDQETQTDNNDNTNANNTDVTEVTEQELKGTLLDAQMAVVEAAGTTKGLAVASYPEEAAKVAAQAEEVKAMEAGEDKTAAEEALTQAQADLEVKAEEVKATADQAIADIEAIEVTGLTTEMNETLDSSLVDLKAYFTEAKTAIDANIMTPDYTTANEKFESFNTSFGTLFEEVGLLVPDMSKDLLQ